MSTVASDLLIRTYAKRLKLPAVAASADRLAAEAAAAGHGPLEFLAALLGAEVAQREANVERARIRAARFPELAPPGLAPVLAPGDASAARSRVGPGKVASPVPVEAADAEPEELIPGAEAGMAPTTEGDLELLAQDQVFEEEALVAQEGANERGEEKTEEFDLLPPYRRTS